METFRILDDDLAVASSVDASGWCLNTILLRVPGGLLAYSPTRRLGDGIHDQIRAFGAPTILVAPNHFHHLGLPEWSRRHPGAALAASDRARPRLERKQRGLRFRSLTDVELPAGASWLVPDGLKNGEAWIRIRKTWIACDAFLNLEPPLSGFKGLVLRALGIGPGLRVAGTWRPLHVESAGVYRAWLLSALEAHRPSRLVLAHGAVAEGADLADRLAALMG
jgi:hypothetical protein